MKSMEEVKKLRKMSYGEMAELFREKERNGQSLTGYITFTEDSFDMQYSEEARTYEISSNNKAYRPNMGGYSIYGSSMDGTDVAVRLERYMRDEKGGEDGWQIEACYVDEPDDRDHVKEAGMDDLISRKGLYEKTVALEKEAMEHCLKLARENGDPTDRMIWQAITTERAAFKHNVCDAPPAQQWHTEPPKESGFYIVYTDSGEIGECVYTDDGEWDTDRNYRFPMWCQVVAWMPMPKPYKGEA